MVRLELVISDTCQHPQLIETDEITRVVIGREHSFDEILDITSGRLENDEIALLHKLWSDDTFPRNFVRIQDELIITERRLF